MRSRLVDSDLPPAWVRRLDVGAEAASTGQAGVREEAAAGAGARAWFGKQGSLTVSGQGNEEIRAARPRVNSEVVCGKDFRDGSEHFTTWKALLNIHKNEFIARHK